MNVTLRAHRLHYPDRPSKQFSHRQEIPRYTCDKGKQETKLDGIIQKKASHKQVLEAFHSIFSKDPVL